MGVKLSSVIFERSRVRRRHRRLGHPVTEKFHTKVPDVVGLVDPWIILTFKRPKGGLETTRGSRWLSLWDPLTRSFNRIVCSAELFRRSDKTTSVPKLMVTNPERKVSQSYTLYVGYELPLMFLEIGRGTLRGWKYGNKSNKEIDLIRKRLSEWTTIEQVKKVSVWSSYGWRRFYKEG